MIKNLTLIYSDHKTTKPPYKLHFELQKTLKNIDISITCEKEINTDWIISNNFDHEPKKNWGLWNFDVIELFWQNRKSTKDIEAQYHEWQISPNNKNFCLTINKPRVSYFTPLHCPIKFHSQATLNTWIATFSLPNSFCQNEDLPYLGAFAILGPLNNRSYYALNLAPTHHPNFHLPEFFLPIAELS